MSQWAVPDRPGTSATVPFFRSLRWRLLATGLVIWGLSVVVLAAGANWIQGNVLRKQTLTQLAALAGAHADHIETVLSLITRQVEAVAATEQVRDVAMGRRADVTSEWLRTRVIYPVLPVERMTVVNRAGFEVLDTDESAAPWPPIGMPLTEIRRTVHLTPSLQAGESPVFDLVVPITDTTTQQRLGWLRARLRISGLYHMLLDATADGQSTELYLVGPEQQILSPLRFLARDGGVSSATWQVPAVRAAIPAASGAGEFRDYRQVPTLMAAAPIATTQWRLVAKVDRGEALAPLHQLAHSTLTLVLLAALAGAAAALTLSDRLVRPLGVLSQAATGMAAGRWDVRVPVNRRDELGAVGQAFNHMADAVEAVMEALRRSEAKFAGILDIAPDAVIAVNQDQRIVLFNTTAEKTFGYTAAEVLGQPLDILIPPSCQALHREHVRDFGASGRQMRRMGERRDVGSVGRRKNGEIFPTEASISRLQLGNQTLYIAIVRDVTERRRSDEALRQSEERFRTAFANAPIGMALVGTDGRWLQVNGALCEMLGYSESELLAMTLQERLHPDDAGGYQREWQRLLAGATRCLQVEQRHLHRQGHEVYLLLSVSPVYDAGGQPMHLIAQLQDITERKRSEAQLAHLANYDPLTNLFNRRRFQAELERELVRVQRHGDGGAVLFLDLDKFKEVNDTLGHQAGDQLLQSVAGLLRARLRRTDVLARLGGDEFAVLLPQTEPQEAAAVAEQLVAALRQHSVNVGDRTIRITASCGVALFPLHGATVDELVTHADLAMYNAKESGRNDVRLYQRSPGRLSAAGPRLGIEQRLREALAHDRLVLHAQPILALADNRIQQCELLVRLRGETGRLLAARMVVGVAEGAELVRDLDHWVVTRALQVLAARGHQDRELSVGVNVSGKAFADRSLLERIERGLAQTGVDPARLVLEFTETAAMADMQQAREFVAALAQLGCRSTVDDFGMGLACFENLKQLPVHYLKIDGGIVRNLLHDPEDRRLVSSIVQAAQGLGICTVAKHVENAETLALLREFGVDLAQGYYIGRPLALADFLHACTSSVVI